MDLDVVMRSSDCKYIVKFYGVFFIEVYVMRNIFFLDIFSVYSFVFFLRVKCRLRVNLSLSYCIKCCYGLVL